MHNVHTAALLPPEIRKIVEIVAKREDRTIAAQMRQLTLKGLEALGEWPVNKNSNLNLKEVHHEKKQKK